MAAYLRLKDRDTGEIIEDKKLIELDDKMRNAFGIQPDPEKWLYNWMDTIGFSLATGKTFDEILSDNWWLDEERHIICWLQERYENASYFCR